MSFPVELWMKVARYAPQNPIVYLRCRQVSKEFCTVFSSDELWERFSPVDCVEDLCLSFISRVESLSVGQKHKLFQMWRLASLIWSSHIPHARGAIIEQLIDRNDLNQPDIGLAVLWISQELMTLRDAREFFGDFTPSQVVLRTALKSLHACYLLRLWPEFAKEQDVPVSVCDISQVSELYFDYSRALRAVSWKGTNLKYLKSEFQNDFAIVLEAVQNQGMALEFSSRRLQENIEIVFAAIDNDLRAFRFVGPKLKKNRRVTMRALSQPTENLLFLPKFTRDNFAIMRAAAASLENTPQFDELDANLEFFTKLCSVNGLFFEYASSRLRDDEGLAKIAIANNGVAYQWISERSRKDKELACFAMYCAGFEQLLNPLDPEILKDLQVRKQFYQTKVCIGNNIMVSRDSWVPSLARYSGDKGRVVSVIKNHGAVFQYAAPKFRTNKALLLLAMKSYLPALACASRSLKRDPDFAREAVEFNGMALQYFDATTQDRYDIVLTAVKQCGLALNFASHSLRSNVNIVRIAISNNYLAVMSVAWPCDPSVVLMALKSCEAGRSLDMGLPAECRHEDHEHWQNAVHA